jgi:transcriptional regulator with XRE-family HTH domain
MVQIPRLREWREARALTQVELAGRAGVSSRSVAGYEAGTGARPPTVRKLAEALGVEVADLRGDPEPPLREAPPSPEQPNFNGLLEEERRLGLLAPIPPAAKALNALFAPKVDANDFTIEEYEQVGEAFARLDAAMADAMSSEYIRSEEGASEAEREAFNRAGAFHSGGPMYDLRYTLQRAYEELVRREEAGVTKLEEFRQRAG